MKTIITRLATAGILLLTAQFALAAPMEWFDEGDFTAANPGLNYENFDFLGDPGVIGCNAPLNSTTGPAGCWNVGDAIPGYSISTSPGESTPELAVVGPSGGFGNAETAIVANFFVDSFDIFFDDPVDTVGFNFISFLGSDILDITVYLANGDILGGVLGGAASGSFFGFSGFGLISRINLFDQGGGAEGVYDSWFGMAVPEPGTLALLGLGLFGMGLSRRRKKA